MQDLDLLTQILIIQLTSLDPDMCRALRPIHKIDKNKLDKYLNDLLDSQSSK